MRYSFVDLETTGGNREGNKITEIAIINYDGAQIEGEWTTLINPERSIPWSITQLTGIDNAMVESAPRFYEVAKKIVELTQDRILVAHNAFFDYRFLQREFSELGFTFQRDVMCTVRLSRKAFPGLQSYSLSNLSRYFQIPREAEHRALDDTRACLAVFQKIQKVSQVSITEDPQKPLPQKLELHDIERLPQTPGTYFFYTEKGLLLYVGKAKNIKARVKSHFQKAGDKKREQEIREHVARIEFMEWGSDLVASLMEFYFIKTLRPTLNRANRKTQFRYILTLNTESEPGAELRVSTIKDDDEVSLRFGSRQFAQDARERIYKEAFAVEADGLFFVDKMRQFRRVLGSEQVIDRLKEKMQPRELLSGDHVIREKGRTPGEFSQVVIQNGELKEIQLVQSDGEVEVHRIESYPDLKRIVARYLTSSQYSRDSATAPEE
jgi:DNA polymerase-3 subunit epsilon